MQPFDMIIITAANKAQAHGYERQLEWRRRQHALPDHTEFRVIPVPMDRRVGSGASTIHVLSILSEDYDGDLAKTFEHKRILILHSGGDSRRLPAYATVGKLFAPLPTQRYLALFDALIDIFQELPYVPGGQVIVTSGDVLLNFDAQLLEFSPIGVTGVAYPDDAQTASRHGVYVTEKSGSNGRLCDVQDFLQKPEPEVLAQIEATSRRHVLVDTGIINLGLDAVQRLRSSRPLVEAIRSGERFLDFYQDITFALLGKNKVPELDIEGIEFRVSTLPYCGFYHIGTTQQLLQNLYTITHAGALYQFENAVRTNAVVHPDLKSAYACNAIVETDDLSVAFPVFIENCILDGEIELHGENVVTGLPAGTGRVLLKEGHCLSFVTLRDGNYAGLLYGCRDSFKGGMDSLFLNRPLRDWLDKIPERDIWLDGDPQDIWHARLFPVHRDSSHLMDIFNGVQESGELTAEFMASNRQSMHEIMLTCDHDRFLDQLESILRRASLSRIAEALNQPDFNPQQVFGVCQSPEDYQALLSAIDSALDRSENLLHRSRLMKLKSRIPDVKQADAIRETAFALIRDAIGEGIVVAERQEPIKLAIRTDEVVWVSLPARLDFGGGWSDTPPYCLEYGGSVLNAAVRLNGQYPIQVVGKRVEEPVIRINSIDLGVRAIIRTQDELQDFTDPSDWLSLPKAAFAAAGVVGSQTGTLDSVLESMGGGIDITLFSALPAGSGLGTSSILGAGLIQCLSSMFDLGFSQEEIFKRTLYMEQLMTTGGGWQDQVGGVVGGVKLVRTNAGPNQRPNYAWTHLVHPGHDLNERFLLYYTGHRRMAKNILHQIVGRYLDGDATTIDCIASLKTISVRLKDDLDRRDIEHFGAGIAEVWELHKILDEGSTTPDIERLFDRVNEHIVGGKLLGAGGGGFLFMVTRGPEHSRMLQESLCKKPLNERSRFFDFTIDTLGMQVSIL